MAVIGAKLSEGLNFSDDLARMVVIVGLPFANIHSIELKERLKYADYLQGSQPFGNSLFGAAGMQLYENMCMNAVNQSIGMLKYSLFQGKIMTLFKGRAIRHKDDWASLVLLDSRYKSSQIQKKLPMWIRDVLVLSSSFGQSVQCINKFIKSK